MEYAGQHPVNAQPIAGGWVSSGIAYEDYTRMSTLEHKLARSRRYEAPSWVMNAEQLADVVARAVENRTAVLRYLRVEDMAPLPRLTRAQTLLQSAENRQNLIDRLNRLCAAYMEAKESGKQARAKELASLVEGIDTQLCTLDRIAAIMTGVAFLYWRVGYDSVQTAHALQIKPPHVRQILCKLLDFAERAGYPPPAPVVHVPGRHPPRRRAFRVPTPRVPRVRDMQPTVKDKILELRRAGKFSVDIARVLDLGPYGCEIINRVMCEAKLPAPKVPAPPVVNPSYQAYVDYCTRMGIAPRPLNQWGDVDKHIGYHGLFDNGVRKHCDARP
jgi:hypothetical protein